MSTESPLTHPGVLVLQSPDVFEEMYVAFANLLVTDPYIESLLSDKSYVFDFLPFDQIKAVYTKPDLSTIPSDPPHISIAITRMSYKPMSTCSKLGEIDIMIAYESPMHWEPTYKLMSYLSSMLAVKVFLCQDRTVRVMSSSATPTYNVPKNSVSVQQNATLHFEMRLRD